MRLLHAFGGPFAFKAAFDHFLGSLQLFVRGRLGLAELHHAEIFFTAAGAGRTRLHPVPGAARGGGKHDEDAGKPAQEAARSAVLRLFGHGGHRRHGGVLRGGFGLFRLSLRGLGGCARFGLRRACFASIDLGFVRGFGLRQSRGKRIGRSRGLFFGRSLRFGRGGWCGSSCGSGGRSRHGGGSFGIGSGPGSRGRLFLFGLPLTPQRGRGFLHSVLRALKHLPARSFAGVGVGRNAHQGPGFVKAHGRDFVGKRRREGAAHLDAVDAALFIGVRVGAHEGHQDLIHRGLGITRTVERSDRPHRHTFAHDKGLVEVVVGRVERQPDRPGAGGRRACRARSLLHGLFDFGSGLFALHGLAHGRHVLGFGRLGSGRGAGRGNGRSARHRSGLGCGSGRLRSGLTGGFFLRRRHCGTRLELHFVELGRELACVREFNDQRELVGVNGLGALDGDRIGIFFDERELDVRKRKLHLFAHSAVGRLGREAHAKIFGLGVDVADRDLCLKRFAHGGKHHEAAEFGGPGAACNRCGGRRDKSLFQRDRFGHLLFPVFLFFEFTRSAAMDKNRPEFRALPSK